ncbi:type II toxin-antitoxin system PemK/MazF family toxin [Bacillus sp. FSL K6-0994]|uniref:type II toxin-antitoxin system PemK/MazF family toxin n=1 Tax=Bacillus sp. FSL K6-0994 TaxID=2921457 RepID=UPI00315B08B2
MGRMEPSRGDIYWADLEPVKGSEQGGFRPVFVVSNNLMNQTAPICICVPITRDGEKVKNYPFNVQFDSGDWIIDTEAIQSIKKMGNSFANQGGFLLCNQARAISKNRLHVRMGTFKNNSQLKKVEDAIIHSFGLNLCEKCETPLRPGGLKCGKCNRVHSKKCSGCKTIHSVKNNFCPQCGSGRGNKR